MSNTISHMNQRFILGPGFQGLEKVIMKSLSLALSLDSLSLHLAKKGDNGCSALHRGTVLHGVFLQGPGKYF